MCDTLADARRELAGPFRSALILSDTGGLRAWGPSYTAALHGRSAKSTKLAMTAIARSVMQHARFIKQERCVFRVALVACLFIKKIYFTCAIV